MSSFFAWGLATIVASTLVACGGSSSSEDNGGSAGTGASGASGGSSNGGGGGSDGGVGGSAGVPSGGGSAGMPSGGVGGGGSAQACFADKYDGLVYVDYDQFNPIIDSTCSGTNHQDIKDVEKLVFLGDSITVGTFPTPANQVYRELLTAKAQAKWPGIEVQSCAVNGATTDDFFNGDKQIPTCFPAPEQKKTLIVITMGGNDLKDIAQKKDTISIAEANTMADQVVAQMKAALVWLKDPTNFPNGSYVVFANVYEYTDLTGDLSSCPLAQVAAGLSGEWVAGMTVLGNSREGYMKAAVDTGTDMIFLGETFCGHGYKFNDATGQCYEPNSNNWFDLSCIHPTPEGHGHLADLFWNTISE